MLTIFPETADIETSSEDYARRFAGKVGDWFLKVQTDATLHMLAQGRAAVRPGASILDVGGGHAQTASALVDSGYRLTVLGSAEVCAARLQPWLQSGRCQFKVGNILDLPYPDQSFDVVLSYRLLPHVTAWQPYLAELARVARQAVILDYPEVRSINYIAPALFRFKKRLEGNTRPYTCFRQSQLAEVFARSGFEPAERRAEFFLPMVLHRKLGQPALSAAMEKVFRALGLSALFGSPVILKMVRKGW
jgi:2-polyprenyl-3-methyl-5-hydroxy-6-metoxy-1,4-benzoquinol methylase